MKPLPRKTGRIAFRAEQSPHDEAMWYVYAVATGYGSQMIGYVHNPTIMHFPEHGHWTLKALHAQFVVDELQYCFTAMYESDFHRMQLEKEDKAIEAGLKANDNAIRAKLARG